MTTYAMVLQIAVKTLIRHVQVTKNSKQFHGGGGGGAHAER